jgi:hypothetical protein
VGQSCRWEERKEDGSVSGWTFDTVARSLGKGKPQWCSWHILSLVSSDTSWSLSCHSK